MANKRNCVSHHVERQPSSLGVLSAVILDSTVSCDVTERDLPTLSQSSRGQRVKRERLRTRLMERVIRVVIITVLRLETKEFNFLLSFYNFSAFRSLPWFQRF